MREWVYKYFHLHMACGEWRVIPLSCPSGSFLPCTQGRHFPHLQGGRRKMLARQQAYFLALMCNIPDLKFDKYWSRCQSTSPSWKFFYCCSHIFLQQKTASCEAIDYTCSLSSTWEVVLEANIFHSVHSDTCSDVIREVIARAPTPCFFTRLSRTSNILFSRFSMGSISWAQAGTLSSVQIFVSVSGECHYTPADSVFSHLTDYIRAKLNENPVMISRLKSSCDCVCGCGAKVWK